MISPFSFHKPDNELLADGHRGYVCWGNYIVCHSTDRGQLVFSRFDHSSKISFLFDSTTGSMSFRLNYCFCDFYFLHCFLCCCNNWWWCCCPRPCCCWECCCRDPRRSGIGIVLEIDRPRSEIENGSRSAEQPPEEATSTLHWGQQPQRVVAAASVASTSYGPWPLRPRTRLGRDAEPVKVQACRNKVYTWSGCAETECDPES